MKTRMTITAGMAGDGEKGIVIWIALEEVSQKLEKSLTRVLRPLQLLAFKIALLYTCSTEKGLNAPFCVEQIKDRI